MKFDTRLKKAFVEQAVTSMEGACAQLDTVLSDLKNVCNQFYELKLSFEAIGATEHAEKLETLHDKITSLQETATTVSQDFESVFNEVNSNSTVSTPSVAPPMPAPAPMDAPPLTDDIPVDDDELDNFGVSDLQEDGPSLSEDDIDVTI